MLKIVPIRLILIIFIIFQAYTFHELPWNADYTRESGGICEEYSSNFECLKGTGIKEVFIFDLIFDLPTLYFIWGITIFGFWFKGGNLIAKLERGSHLAKDAGELCAALGAIIVFTMPFNEAMLSKAFGIVFLGYFWGHLTGIILITITNYLKTREGTIESVHSSI